MEQAGQASLDIPPVSFRYTQEEIDRLADVVKSTDFIINIMDSMPEILAVLTSSRQVIAANHAMLVFLGLGEGEFQPGPRPGELVGCIHSCVSPHGCGSSQYCSQCGALNTIMESLANNQMATGECRITFNKDGCKASLDLSLWCTPFEVQGHRFSILAGVDISDKKRREALETIFFHDILNTFSVLLGNIELLTEQNSRVDPSLVESMRGAARSLSEDISAQRDVMWAEQGEIRVYPSVVNTKDILTGLTDIYANWRGQARNLSLDTDCEELVMETDPILLRRVLGNMLKNAIEASEPGQKVTAGCWRSGGRVEFWVRNQAEMPEDVQLCVFQRSFSTKGKGRGQGTYSMRLLTERYLGGEVDFVSRPGQGTTFFARFPVMFGGEGEG